jgi:hypothetical protein
MKGSPFYLGEFLCREQGDRQNKGFKE